MELISKYTDRSHFGVREYSLYPDRIEIRHNDTLKHSGEGIIRLTDLSPNYHKGELRSSIFGAGLWMTIIPWLIYWALIELTKVDPYGTFAGFFLAMGFAGVFMLLVGARKQKYITFLSLSGVASLTIFKEGPQKGEFDKFLIDIVKSIDRIHSTNEPNEAT